MRRGEDRIVESAEFTGSKATFLEDASINHDPRAFQFPSKQGFWACTKTHDQPS